MGLSDIFGTQQPQPTSTDSSNTKLAEFFKAKTKSYNPDAPVYGAMPQMVAMPAFMPGQQQGLVQQLAAGYGGAPAEYMAQMNSVYAPMMTTRLREPITATARAWGLKPTGAAGGWEAAGKKGKDFNKAGYQQWGMATGSPFLNALFGLKPGFPETTPEEPVQPSTKTSSSSSSSSSSYPVIRSGGIW